MPTFAQVGDFLKRKYENAVQVRSYIIFHLLYYLLFIIVIILFIIIIVL